MTSNPVFLEYSRIMNSLDIDEAAKQRIIKNCARYSTMKKINSGKFRIIAVIKEKTTHKI